MQSPTDRPHEDDHADKPGDRDRAADEVDRLLDRGAASNPLRRAARLRTAGFPPEIDEATRRRLSPVAMKACGRLAQHWHLDTAQIAALLVMKPAEYQEGIASPERVLLAPEQFDRAGLLIEIFVSLAQLFRGDLAFNWPTLPNAGPYFDGRSPIELMQARGLEGMRQALGRLQALALGL